MRCHDASESSWAYLAVDIEAAVTRCRDVRESVGVLWRRRKRRVAGRSRQHHEERSVVAFATLLLSKEIQRLSTLKQDR